ncbi:MAG: LPS export ABC transporter periplasmic protein LptC [Spirochaetaceae bacterium]|jgi:LPS export ABC transporter protein LptC|nr:LPS export ABC transporter periplasmic protein LptC [Spirochaetaceae bacterium]
MRFYFFCFVLLFFAILYSSCTFIYGNEQAEEYIYPELTMENLDYIRMRNGEMLARLRADLGNRYESKHIMELSNYQFEQYNTNTNKIDAAGDGGAASIDIISNNIQMKEGVKIRVDSEDFSLRAGDLDWQDKQKVLSGSEDSIASVTRSNGTEINGTGFHSDVRSRTWVFNSDVNGIYVSDEETEEENVPKENTPDENTPAPDGQ